MNEIKGLNRVVIDEKKQPTAKQNSELDKLIINKSELAIVAG